LDDDNDSEIAAALVYLITYFISSDVISFFPSHGRLCSWITMQRRGRGRPSPRTETEIGTGEEQEEEKEEGGKEDAMLLNCRALKMKMKMWVAKNPTAAATVLEKE
jgi:hypothetical protein